jgi:hypothetical protein
MNSDSSFRASPHLYLCEFEFPFKIFFACAISLDKVFDFFLKNFEKTRRHEGIVPLVALEQGACLLLCKDAGYSN